MLGRRVVSKTGRLRAIPLTAALLLLCANAAEAHADYERSDPGDAAVVSSPPEQLTIWFTQELFRREGENWIQVEGPGGERVEAGEAMVDDDDRTQLSVALQPELEPGSYLVIWRSLSAEDGDTAEGEFGFSYDPQAQVTSTPMPQLTPTPFPSLTVEAPPTAVQPSPMPQATLSSTNGPENGADCALGLVPVAGLATVMLPRARRKRRAA